MPPYFCADEAVRRTIQTANAVCFNKNHLARREIRAVLRRLRHTVAILIYLTCVFLGAALLSPLAWKAVFSDWAFLQFLNDHDDFHRYFNRCLLGLALLGLGLLCRFSGIQSASEIGWAHPRKHWPWLSKGLLLGLASLTAAAALPLLTGAREWLPTPALAEWTRHFANALLAGVLVAVIEETLFRGVLFGLLRRDLPWRWAAVIGSLFFAAMHFLDQKPELESITWASGFSALPAMVHDFANDPYWVAKFINLTLAGIILCALWQRTGNLFCSIGVHAGWIFCLKTNGFITQSTAETASTFWGNGQISDGWAATPLLALMLWFIMQSNEEHPPPD